MPQLTHKLVQYLDPQPTNRILDVGCGDGKFTTYFIGKVARVYGVDASSSFIESARTDYGSETALFKVVDCRYLEKDSEVVNGTWDKVYDSHPQLSSRILLSALTLIVQSLERCTAVHTA